MTVVGLESISCSNCRNRARPITASDDRTEDDDLLPARLRPASGPGRHSTASTIRIGYSATQLNTCGATRPAAMPPIMPPADIHM